MVERPLDSKEIKPVNLKGNQPWIFIGRTDTEAEAPIPWPLMQRDHSLEKTLMLGKIEGGRKRGQREWDGWMASLTQWTWVWANSRRWWRTRKSDVLQSMGSQRVRHDLATEQQRDVTSLQLCIGAMRKNVDCDGPTGSSPLSFLDFRIWPWGHDILEALAHSGSLLRTTV